MGAKSPIKLRNRYVAYKCNLCGRSPDALVAHQRTAYNVYTKRRGRPSHTSRPVEPPKAQVKKDVEDENEDQSSPINASKTRVEFECPKCFKAFPTYFTALKHIQKYHCVNRQNIPVQPHHGNIIQPVRVEVCVKCMEKVKSIKSHICTADSNNIDDGAKLFVCAACEEWFPNLKTFDSHVVTTHGDNIECMFFPTQLEFTKWKTELEQQMNVSYSSIEQYDSKWYYHCDFVKDGRDKGKTNYICPSTIVVQEFTKGIQVHFYHQHHKHCSLEYNLSHKYKKNSISSFMKRTEDYNNLANLKQDENDLYMQFKALMEGIIVDAAKINIATLKVLLGKALEITAILTNYDEELDDISTVVLNPKQSISDVEITKLLGVSLTKRKAIEASTTNVLDVSLTKHKKNEIPTFTTSIPVGQQILIERNENVDLSSPKIVNSFSLAEGVKSKSTPMNTLTDKSNKELEAETEEEKKSKLNGDDTPSSFNDSYKDFVKNFVNMESVASRTRSKPVLKTLIGQFKPNLMEIDDKPKSLHVPPRVLDDKPKLVVDSNKSAEEKLKLVPRTNKQTYSSTAIGEPVIITQNSKSDALRPKPVKPDMKSGYTTEYMTETDMLAVRFPCPMCNKGYPTKEAMQDHFNYQHLGKTTHKCPVCNKPISSRANVMTHMTRVHGEKKAKPRNHVCQQCGKAFTDKKALTQHCIIHSGERPLCCDICQQTFKLKASLYTHRKRVHKVFPAKRNVEFMETKADL